MDAINGSPRDEISDLVNLYALAVDTKNWDWFDLIFTDDVVADFPAQEWTSLRQWKSDFEAFHDAFAATQHHMNVMHFVARSDGVHTVTYGSWLLMRELDGDTSTQLRGQGWYQDQFIFTDQGWRIKKRICRMVASEGSHSEPGLYTSSLAQDYASGALDALRDSMSNAAAK